MRNAKDLQDRGAAEPETKQEGTSRADGYHEGRQLGPLGQVLGEHVKDHEVRHRVHDDQQGEKYAQKTVEGH